MNCKKKERNRVDELMRSSSVTESQSDNFEELMSSKTNKWVKEGKVKMS